MGRNLRGGDGYVNQLACSCEVVPVQLVDATPLLSSDLTVLFTGPSPGGCSSLLPEQDAFSLHLSLRTILNH
jgi:hypothetical protein